MIQWGTAVPPLQSQIHITTISYESGTVHLGISNTFPNPIHVQLLVSDNLFQWQEFERKEIPSGDSQWTVDTDAFDQTAFFRMVNGELFAGFFDDGGEDGNKLIGFIYELR